MGLLNAFAGMLGIYELSSDGEILVTRGHAGYVGKSVIRVSTPKGDDIVDKMRDAVRPLSGRFLFLSQEPERNESVGELARRMADVERRLREERSRFLPDAKRMEYLEKELTYYTSLCHGGHDGQVYSTALLVISCTGGSRAGCVSRLRKSADTVRRRLKKGLLSVRAVTGQELMLARESLSHARLLK